MKILFINEAFWPDHAATAQYLHDAAAFLVRQGHEVTVLCSRYGYSGFAQKYPIDGQIDGVRVCRVGYLRWPRRGVWARAWNMIGLLAALWTAGLRLGRFDRAVVLSSPPFAVFAAVICAKIKKIPLVYWLMDLNPDEAAAIGWISEKSCLYRFLDKRHLEAMGACSRIIVLDDEMRDRVLAKGIAAQRVVVRGLWPVAADERAVESPALADAVGRHEFTVLYSGNLSLCHPVQTALDAALALREDPGVVFEFVGGGERMKEVEAFARKHRLGRLRCSPYVAREELGRKIRSADLLLVAMGDPMRGIVHPSKIYDMIWTGKPWVYLGPADSFIDRFARAVEAGRRVSHGDTEAFLAVLAEERGRSAEERNRLKEHQLRWAREHLDRNRGLRALAESITGQ